MGSEIQRECKECCHCRNVSDAEVKKNGSNNILRGIPNKNGGDPTLQSFQNNNLSFLENNAKVASLVITNPNIYQKMNKGERLHQLLEPLTSFLNKNLLETVNLLLNKVIELNKRPSSKNTVYTLFENNYKELINTKILDNLNYSDLGYFTKVKFNLIYAVEIIAELYHYFNYHLNDGREPYNVYYWEYIKNPVSYMKERVNDLFKCIKDINDFIMDNKSKNTNNYLDIHITATNFNIQLAQ
jgi:hypothetical protein